MFELSATRRMAPIILLGSSALCCSLPVLAQQQTAAAGPAVEEIIVTAQKREEKLQSVPISIQALDSRKLFQAGVASLDDYTKLLPSLTIESFGPGQAQLSIRGVTSGGDGLAVGSQPTVGLYLDEIPVTTIAGSVDLHIYDVARVEALSGPQGTLFGSSSLAGTLRVITNKPSTSKFSAGYDVEASHVSHGTAGGKGEGFVNVPLSDKAAIRLVGYYEHDGGFIDNVPRPRTYPTSGITSTNPAQNDFNKADTIGGRAALKVNLDENWTVLPQLIYQNQRYNGTFDYRPSSGDLNTASYAPNTFRDRWYQAALTVEGKIGALDVVYAGGYFGRKVNNTTDYSDYSFYYDVSSGPSFGSTFVDNKGNFTQPDQYTVSSDKYTKQTHEFRVSSPKGDRLRFVAGLFFQRQSDKTRGEFRNNGLADAASITGQPGILYLNAQYRVDRDYAAFSDVSFDVFSNLTATGGIRVFGYSNSVIGFFGYNGALKTDGTGLPVHATGEALCKPSEIGTVGPDKPCNDINAKTVGSGVTYKGNLTYKFDPDKLAYITVSKGFRPGGINRIPGIAPYKPDFITNFELGWKTSWFDHRFRLNGAIFYEKWKDPQFGFSGPNGITVIVNAGPSRIAGVESDFSLAVDNHLTVSGSATYLGTKTQKNSCKVFDPTFVCAAPNVILAPAGTRLPVSSKLKLDATARYQFDIGGFNAHVQGSVFHTSAASPALATAEASILQYQPAYTSADFSIGIAHSNWTLDLFAENAFDTRGQTRRFAECAPITCGVDTHVVVIRPQNFRISFGQKF